MHAVTFRVSLLEVGELHVRPDGWRIELDALGLKRGHRCLEVGNQDGDVAAVGLARLHDLDAARSAAFDKEGAAALR